MYATGRTVVEDRKGSMLRLFLFCLAVIILATTEYSCTSVVDWTSLAAGPAPAALSLPLINRKRGENKIKNSRVEISTERSLNNYHCTQNRLNLENWFNLLSFENRVGWWKKKKDKNLLPRLNFAPSFLTPLLSSPQPCAVPGDGEWGLWSVHNSSSLLLLRPHMSALLQHGCFPWAAVLQDKPAPPWTLQGLQGNFCPSASSNSSPPSSPTLVFAGLFLSLFYFTRHTLLGSVLPSLQPAFSTMAAGLSHALRGVGRGRLDPAVSSLGQLQPLLPSQGLPAAPVNEAWAPAPCTTHLTR